MTTQTPDAVREAIVKYTQHYVGCAVYGSWADGEPKCSCGLDEARASLAALDSRAGDAGEPVAWQWERRGRYGPTDGATIGKWERVLTHYAPDAWPEADRRNIVPLYAATPAPAVDAVPAGEVRDLEWFGSQHMLSLEHHAPRYGDDNDQAVEWRVHEESGGLNDREWTVMGRGDTPAQAIAAARAALSHGEGRK